MKERKCVLLFVGNVGPITNLEGAIDSGRWSCIYKGCSWSFVRRKCEVVQFKIKRAKRNGLGNKMKVEVTN